MNVAYWRSRAEQGVEPRYAGPVKQFPGPYQCKAVPWKCPCNRRRMQVGCSDCFCVRPEDIFAIGTCRCYSKRIQHATAILIGTQSINLAPLNAKHLNTSPSSSPFLLSVIVFSSVACHSRSCTKMEPFTAGSPAYTSLTRRSPGRPLLSTYSCRK